MTTVLDDTVRTDPDADALVASAAGPEVVFEATPVQAQPPSVSLLSSAYDVTSLLDAIYGANHWLNGFQFEPEVAALNLATEFPYWWKCPEAGGFTAEQVSPTSDGATHAPGSTSAGVKIVPAKPGNVDTRPLIAHTADPCISTFGMFGRNAEERALRALDANLPRIIENEFWTGARATNALFPNAFLNGTVPSATVLNPVPGTAIGYNSALSELEQALSDRDNRDGFIHASRRLVSLWCSEHSVEPSPSGRQLKTRLGTTVIPGQGYPGTGPAGATGGVTATRSTQWAYATGPVMYARTPTRILLNATPDLGYPHLNANREAERVDFRVAQDRKVRAEADFAVFWDKKVNVAVKVDLLNELS